MTCEEELNALRQAEQELAAWREQHSGGVGTAVPQRLAELTAAVRQKQDAYRRCQGEGDAGDDIESLMRYATGEPLGGDAGPPT